MNLSRLSSKNILAVLSLVLGIATSASPSLATVTVGHLDDYNDGTTQHWRIGQLAPYPLNEADAGPLGTGDHALYHTNDPDRPGTRSMFVVLNEDNFLFPGPGNWEGDWTAAGVTKISLDVRNPATLLGATDLDIRLGIAGPGGAGSFGDVYVTQPQTVLANDMWTSLVFDVLPSDWVATGFGMDINAALADVTQFRIINSPFNDFVGSSSPAEFYVDNIMAIGAPVTEPGDYNGNGIVDATDYVVWRDLEGQSGAGLAADATGPGGVPDGTVDQLDYEFWRARFGNPQPGGGHIHGSGASLAAVPEPATPLLCLIGLLAVAAQRRSLVRGRECAN